MFGMLMKSAFLITIVFAVCTLLSVQNTKAASTETAFDGTWWVTLNTHDYKDPNTGQVALAYVDHFPAEIKNGILHGEYATRGLPGWLEIDGKIGADGTALLHVKALTGPAKYNFQYKGQGTPHSPPGKPYAYDVNAHFKGRRGSGRRIGGRIGIFDFVKN
jgi:hypothetical protein